MESTLTYFWLPFVIALAVYFIFIAFKAIDQSLEIAVKKKSSELLNDEATEKKNKNDFITIRKSELAKILESNILLQEILVQYLKKYQSEKNQ